MENRNTLNMNSYLYAEVWTVAKLANIPLPTSFENEDPLKNPFFRQALVLFCARQSAMLIKKYEENIERLTGDEWKKLAYQIQQKKQQPFSSFDFQPTTSDKISPISAQKVDASNNALLKQLTLNVLETYDQLKQTDSKIQNKNQQVQEISKEIQELQIGVIRELTERFNEFKKYNKDTTLTLPTDEKIILERVNSFTATSNPMEQIKQLGLLFRPTEESELSEVSNLVPSLLESLLFYSANMMARLQKTESLTAEILELENKKLEPKNNQLDQQMRELVNEQKQANNTPFSIRPSFGRSSSKTKTESETETKVADNIRSKPEDTEPTSAPGISV